MERAPVRLQETHTPLPADAHIIDAAFAEVRGERRTAWGRIKAALRAALWAATIGFLIPPAWILFQRIGEAFRPY